MPEKILVVKTIKTVRSMQACVFIVSTQSVLEKSILKLYFYNYLFTGRYAWIIHTCVDLASRGFIPLVQSLAPDRFSLYLYNIFS